MRAVLKKEIKEISGFIEEYLITLKTQLSDLKEANTNRPGYMGNLGEGVEIFFGLGLRIERSEKQEVIHLNILNTLPDRIKEYEEAVIVLMDPSPRVLGWGNQELHYFKKVLQEMAASKIDVEEVLNMAIACYPFMQNICMYLTNSAKKELQRVWIEVTSDFKLESLCFIPVVMISSQRVKRIASIALMVNII